MGGCGPWGGAGGELGSTLFGNAGSRPNRGCGKRAAAEASRRTVTKPHRPRTYRDAGRERALGAASRAAGARVKPEQYLKSQLVEDSEGVAGPGLRWTGGASAILGRSR